MSTSDRVCPEHGDIGALPSANFCPTCGKGLVMKGIFRSAVETLPAAVVIGAGVGFGSELGRDMANGLTDCL